MESSSSVGSHLHTSSDNSYRIPLSPTSLKVVRVFAGLLITAGLIGTAGVGLIAFQMAPPFIAVAFATLQLKTNAALIGAVVFKVSGISLVLLFKHKPNAPEAPPVPEAPPIPEAPPVPDISVIKTPTSPDSEASSGPGKTNASKKPNPVHVKKDQPTLSIDEIQRTAIERAARAEKAKKEAEEKAKKEAEEKAQQDQNNQLSTVQEQPSKDQESAKAPASHPLKQASEPAQPAAAPNQAAPWMAEIAANKQKLQQKDKEKGGKPSSVESSNLVGFKLRKSAPPPIQQAAEPQTELSKKYKEQEAVKKKKEEERLAAEKEAEEKRQAEAKQKAEEEAARKAAEEEAKRKAEEAAKEQAKKIADQRAEEERIKEKQRQEALTAEEERRKNLPALNKHGKGPSKPPVAGVPNIKMQEKQALLAGLFGGAKKQEEQPQNQQGQSSVGASSVPQSPPSLLGNSGIPEAPPLDLSAQAEAEAQPKLVKSTLKHSSNKHVRFAPVPNLGSKGAEQSHSFPPASFVTPTKEEELKENHVSTKTFQDHIEKEGATYIDGNGNKKHKINGIRQSALKLPNLGKDVSDDEAPDPGQDFSDSDGD